MAHVTCSRIYIAADTYNSPPDITSSRARQLKIKIAKKFKVLRKQVTLGVIGASHHSTRAILVKKPFTIPPAAGYI